MPKTPFTPPLLPPKIDYNHIFPGIIRARESIARFDEAVKRLPNPALIQRSFDTKEAVLSSKIEGTQVTLNDVWMMDAENKQDEENSKARDYREVINYRRAITQGHELLGEHVLGETVIKTLHKTLLNSVRGTNKNPGEFRKNQVHIGPPGSSIEQATFVPTPPESIVPLFADLERYMHSDDVIDPLVQIAIAHYQFEAIHPFSDGNGRVGRIMIPLFLYYKGVTTYPNIYVSEYLEGERRTYYRLLAGVSDEGNWIDWIGFFLEAIYQQTEATRKKVTEIETLYAHTKEQIRHIGSVFAHDMLDAIFIKPIFSTTSIKELAKIENPQTLYTVIKKFVEAGIIEDLTPERERKKLYGFTTLRELIQNAS